MKKLFIKIANFFRLLDGDSVISITNIAVWVVLVKIALVQDFNITDAGALFVTLLNYSGKKYLKFSSEKKRLLHDEELDAFKRRVKDTEDKLQQLHDKVGAVQAANGFTKLR